MTRTVFVVTALVVGASSVELAASSVELELHGRFVRRSRGCTYDVRRLARSFLRGMIGPREPAMGMFGIKIALSAVVWLVVRWFRRPETEKCAEDVSARAVRGAHRVGNDLLSSVGGQGTPDFGRVVEEFEPEGEKVVRMDEP